MTREHKLALIVGFSLILLVGVLISDHLSSARQAHVGDYGPGDFRIGEVPLVAPTDPLRRDGPMQAVPEEYRSAAADHVPELPSPLGIMPGSEAGVAREVAIREPEFNPVTINQGSLSRQAPEFEPIISRAVAERGGIIRQVNGMPEIVLPAAAQTRQATSRPVEETREFDWYTVKPGERLFKIAETIYGDGNRWRELQKLNSEVISVDGSVRAGARIRFPKMTRSTAAPAGKTGSTSTAPAAGLAPVKEPSRPTPTLATYTVQKGDTLGGISQKTLGTSRRWREILELNNIEDEDHVTTGRVLKIPAR